MNLKSWYNLRKIKTAGSPRKSFKKVLWRELDDVWQTVGFKNYFWYQQPYFRFAVVVIVVLAILGSLGTGAFAYASPRVATGSVLYPLKQNIEKLEEKIKITPTAKAKFYLKQLQRREVEKTVLTNAQKDIYSTEKKIEAIEKNLERASEWVEKKQINNSRLENNIKDRLEKRKQIIKKQ
jgi:hypothetical protein